MTINIAVAVQRGMGSVRPDLPAPPVTELAPGVRGAAPADARGLPWHVALALRRDVQRAARRRPRALPRIPPGDPGARFLAATMAATEQALVEAAERLGTRVPAVRPGSNT
ncbi:MAG: hypothetical protein U1F25_05545 [Rubrivivax sp.]